MLVVYVAAIVLVGFADVMSGAQFFLTVVYLIPVSLAAWHGGRRYGVLLAAIAVSALMVADLLSPLEGVSTAALLWNQLARFAVFLFIVLLITSLRDARHHAELLARTDVLTGVANLFAFREAGSRELERSRRTSQPLTLLFLDIDDFKVVNDYHGHSTGDEVLRRIARALCYAARRGDFVARVGGDEFVVLMPRTDAGDAAGVIDRVESRLATISRPDGSPLTCSIGAATHDPAPASIDEILQEADQAMYRAKALRSRPDAVSLDHAARPLRLLVPSAERPASSEAVGMES